MCSGSEEGSYLRRIDPCITQLKAQGPSRTCNESKEEAHLGGVEEVDAVLIKSRGGRQGGVHLALSQSSWSHQSGETWPFPAKKRMCTTHPAYQLRNKGVPFVGP